MAWENYPRRERRSSESPWQVAPGEWLTHEQLAAWLADRPKGGAVLPPDRTWITTECANCGKTRHALGTYCYPVAFWLTGALFAAAIAAIIVTTIVRICT